MLRTTLIRLTLFAVLSAPTCAEDVTIPIRAERMMVTWTLGAALHTVHGEFEVQNGLLRFDPESKSVSGDMTIDLTTGGSGNAKRDAKMRNDVLETAKYPVAVFTAHSVGGHLNASGTSHVVLCGTLFIHGARHELTLPLDVVTRDGRVESGETRFSVPYVAWGMQNPSVFLLRVSERVDVDVRMIAQPPGQPSSHDY